MDILLNLVLGIARGAIYGGIASIAILSLSLIFRYFTNEKFPMFMGIVLGLGILGIGGGLLAVLEQPTLEGVAEIIIASIVIVWGLNAGDKLAEKIPKRSESLLHILRTRKPRYSTIKLPNSRLIRDISGSSRISDELKQELSEREFVLPTDLPLEELAKRLKRRLVTDWGVGEVELELDDEARVIHLAMAAKDRGISETLPRGSVAAPIKSDMMPLDLAPGDFVRIYLDGDEVIDQIEVKSVNKEDKTITAIMKLEAFERIKGKDASLIVALPSTVRRPIAIEVQKRTGTIEEFNVEKIVSSITRAGVNDKMAEKIAKKVRTRFAKRTTPVTTEKIRNAVIAELEKSSLRIAGRFQTYRKSRRRIKI